MSEPLPCRRIAHVDTGHGMRGGQVQLLMLARGLGARGHRQWIVCPEGSAVERRASAEGFPVFAERSVRKESRFFTRTMAADKRSPGSPQ